MAKRQAATMLLRGLDSIPGPVADDGNRWSSRHRIDPEGLRRSLRACQRNYRLSTMLTPLLWAKRAGVAVGVLFVLIALGTGVGAGVVVDGKLAAGALARGRRDGHYHC